MTTESLVTVIIPTYKRPQLVTHAIASVLRQTHKNLEVLVVDDCSMDDTRSVVEAIADPRVRYVCHETNKGLPAVRNTGIRAARGKYIAFLDDDDRWREDKLEKQLRAIKNYDAVACTAVVDGFALRVHRRPTITLEDLKRGPFAPSGLIAKADALRSVMFDETLRQGEDWDAFIRLAQRHTIGWVAEPLLLYNAGDHARMTNEAKSVYGADLDKRATVLYKHREFLGERWFRFHLADAFLTYIGSRPNKLRCLAHAVKRCGVTAVTGSLCEKALRRVRRLVWMATA